MHHSTVTLSPAPALRTAATRAMTFVFGVLAASLLVPGSQPLAAQSGSFGVSAAVEGDELIIAEPNNHFRPGQVHVYRRGGGDWSVVQVLEAPQAERADGFGTSVARTGNTLFVSQKNGPVHRFQRGGDEWSHAGTLTGTDGLGFDPGCDQYGYCGIDFGLTLAASGPWLLIGEPGPSPESLNPEDEAMSGRIHLFRENAASQWSAAGTLSPADGVPGDGFGSAIAVDAERGIALVGAPRWHMPTADAPGEPLGRVYRFQLEGQEWNASGALPASPGSNAGFGSALALSGDRLVVGSPGAEGGVGTAVLYRQGGSDGAWSRAFTISPLDGERGDLFGSAVGLDGNDIWVGAPTDRGEETGRVYRFDGAGAAGATAPMGPSQRIQFQEPETVTRDRLGARIVAGSGVALVTATGMHHQAGAVFVHRRDGDAWQDEGMLVSPPDALQARVGSEEICGEEGQVGPFDCEGVDLLAFVSTSLLREGHWARGVRMNDNWGWTDPETGREYALVGRNDGTSFVDVTDPSNPVLVGDLPKTPNTPPSQLWRDIKTYDSHAFIVADGAGNHGMQVFDLRRLRNVQDAPAMFEADAHYPNVASVHNIVINEDSGFAYLVGSRGGGETCGGGLHMVDIRTPLSPTFAGCFAHEGTGRQGTGSTHDAQCVNYRGPDERYHGREICLGANENLLSIADVTDKSNPVPLATAAYPNPGYLHQGWLTEDQRYYFMDDEADVIQGTVETTRTMIWDLQDLEDPVLAQEFMGSMPASAHNLYIKDGLMYQANYRHGLHILDVNDPLNPVELAHFDTAPYLTGPGFSAAWSNYPFFESGSIVVTSVQEGFFLLRKQDPDLVF